MRQRNDGVRKRCACRRRAWATCAHPWFFNFKVRGGQHYRFRLDTYAEQPIRSREDAYHERDRLRQLIRSGQFPPVAATPERERRLADLIARDPALPGHGRA